VNYNITGGGSFNKNVNYAYNNVGALSGVGTNLIGTDPNATTNVLNTVTFRATGALNRLHYGNGRRLTMGYNANRQQPASMKVDRTDGTDPIVDYSYDYYGADGLNNNRIKKITDNVDAAYTVDYKYDNYNRLIKAIGGGGGDYSYDPWGNITNFKGTTLSYATNASGAPATNRLASDSAGFNYSYDAAGNQTSAPGGFTYSYDGANRLKTVNGGTATYGYDGDGMKARQTSGGSAVYYVRSNVLDNAAIEVNASGVYRAYVYSANKLVAQQSYDGQFYWMHTDRLGSGRKMTDSTGVAKYRGEFDPYGQMLLSWSASGDSNINSKRFAGYERDTASGLDYANARMYNFGGNGRFMQTDPIRFNIKPQCTLSKTSSILEWADKSKPQDLNLYAYVSNDPVNGVDPTGLQQPNPTHCYSNCSRAIPSVCQAAGNAVGAACLVAAGIAGGAFLWQSCLAAGVVITPIGAVICAAVVGLAAGASCAWAASSAENACKSKEEFECRKACNYWGA
jgi:RHS repeat-associated protein